MTKDLIVYEPIEIPFRKQRGDGHVKRIEKEHEEAFWTLPSAKIIAGKQGCYIFALRAGRGYCPWYVGKTTKSFEEEALAGFQLDKYNDVLFDGRKGRPVMFFVAPNGNNKKVPAATCDKIETFLIQAAYTENPAIKNRQKTKIPDWTIAGVVRPKTGRIPKQASVFKKMMGLK